MPIHAISRFELRPPLTVLAVMIAMGLLIGCSANRSPVSTTPPPPIAKTFHNPVQALVAGGGVVEDCPDPSIIHGQVAGDNFWYGYCTTGPLNDADKDSSRNYRTHLIKMIRTADFATWTYVGDAFAVRPAWIAPTAGMWAPAIKFFNSQYYLYYAAQDTSLPGGGGAIGVATSPSPTGPWTDKGAPLVAPEDASCCPGTRRWAIDPEMIQVNGQNYIYFGSYVGGISARTVSADGLTSDPASEVVITIDNKYEAVNLVVHGGYYYLFASASNCCNGPLTGYVVYAARALNPLGPFVDAQGVSLLDSRVGGTPVLAQNGNRWVGPGHNAVFTDMGGQDWFFYHAIDRNAPYFAGVSGFTKRPAMIDALDWVNGWPVVRGGQGPSDSEQPLPAAQAGQKSLYVTQLAVADQPGTVMPGASDEFNASALGGQWSWVRQPAVGTYQLTGNSFRFNTQAGDLFVDSNNASVLIEPAPTGDYMVETRVTLNIPASGCCQNYVQAGLVIYGDDDNYIRLDNVSFNDTRQTEFAKELSPVPSGYPRYGSTWIGTPGDSTWLRIVKRSPGGVETYTGYTSNDGVVWTRGGAWAHTLGSTAKIGLVSLGGSGFVADFDYVRTSTVLP